VFCDVSLARQELAVFVREHLHLALTPVTLEYPHTDPCRLVASEDLGIGQKGLVLRDEMGSLVILGRRSPAGS
jgi:hypothetical protein